MFQYQYQIGCCSFPLQMQAFLCVLLTRHPFASKQPGRFWNILFRHPPPETKYLLAKYPPQNKDRTGGVEEPIVPIQAKAILRIIIKKGGKMGIHHPFQPNAKQNGFAGAVQQFLTFSGHGDGRGLLLISPKAPGSPLYITVSGRSRFLENRPGR